MIRIISFDMDGTLVDEEFDNHIWNEALPRCYAETKGISLEEAKKFCFSEYNKHKDHDLWTSLDFWFRKFGMHDWKKLIAKNTHLIKIYPETAAVLQALGKNYILIVVTQAPGEFIDVKLKGLKKYFRKVYSSTHHFNKLRKDEDVYMQIMKDFGVKPDEVLHVGNHKEYDYDIPKRLGMNVVFLDREGKHPDIESVKDLREILKIV